MAKKGEEKPKVGEDTFENTKFEMESTEQEETTQEQTKKIIVPSFMKEQVEKSVEVKPKKFELPFRAKIKVMPIPRGSAMIKDPNHVGYFMYPDTEATYTLPRHLSNNTWVKCLEPEEQEFLEKELKEDLSFRKDNPFWTKRKVKIKRTSTLLTGGYEMDISNADTYLDYKILSVQSSICKSWDERNNSPEYRFALVSDGEILNSEVSIADIKQECFEHFSKIKHSISKLSDFLAMFGKKVDETQGLDFMRTEVWNILDKTPEKYKKVISDINYEVKVFINKALTSGGLKLSGRTTYCLNYGSEDVIGRTLQDAIDYLRDKRNNITVMELQARIDQFNKK